MQYVNEVVGRRGAFRALCELQASSKTFIEMSNLHELMKTSNIDDPEDLIADLTATGILHRAAENYYLSTFGERTTHLLRAINGADLVDTLRKLSATEPSLGMYELVREGITETFLRNLVDRPGFGRLYFCSPWINVSETEADLLQQAVRRRRSRYARGVEIFVITRPEAGTRRTIPGGATFFRDLGAAIFLHPRLHTKLYIREPDESGGYSMAILGSENLTRSRYLELGVKINSDSRIIGQLIRYFFDLTNQSDEV